MATALESWAGVYELDPVHSSVQFAVRHVEVSTFRASFGAVEATLVAEAGLIELEGRAVVESISIGEPQEFRDHVVRSADFFAADEHPAVTFRSTNVELAEGGAATVSGELTIRGITRAITAAGTYRPPTVDPFGNVRVGLELRATVDRRGWDMSWQLPLPGGGDALGWDVEITAQLELTRTS